MKKLLLLCTFVAVVSLSAWGQSPRVDGGVGSGKAAAPAVVKHVLKNMYNSTCGAGCGTVTTVPGPNAVDAAVTVNCPGTSGTCLIQADQWIQVSPVSGDGTAICLYVDGVSVNGCYFNGSAPTALYTVDSMSQGITVKFGNHTVQTFFYDGIGGSTYGYYNNNYSVFKP